MISNKLSTTSLDDLVRAYRDAANEHGEASETGDHKVANKAAVTVTGIYAELRRRGREAQSALLPLLADQATGVRLWAASHALEFSPMEGDACLRQIVSSKHFLALSAEMTLKEWQAGRLRFP